MMINYNLKKICYLLLFLLSVTGAHAQLAKCKGKYLGNIIQGSVRSNYNTYWNQATSENGSKWGSVEGTRGVYNFSTSDVAYNWAKSNNGLFKYHNFVWGSQTPGWVSSASTATITAAIENYIKACSTHYTPMGGLRLIDVLNEPVNTAIPSNMKAALTAGYQADPANANDRNNQYGWAIWSFQLARKYFPNATLLINEYNIEMNWNNCRSSYIAIINAIKNAPNLTDGKKNLIDGVGLQCHGIDNLTASNFKACIDEIWTKTGLPVHITEFDQAASPNESKQQSVYSTLIPVAWEHPHVAGITIWGYVQGTTWINGNGTAGPGGTDSGLLYSSNYSANPNGERPAMTWLKQYMASQTSLACCPAPAPFASCTNSNNPPAVAITSPASNASYTAPASVTINATASDADGSVSNVQFYNGTTLLGSDATSPYSFTWTNVAAGTYTITAKATDNAGAATTSTAVKITVTTTTTNTPPAVSITSPANNASYTAPASVTINATASDADGSVSNVQFYNGTTLLGSDATSPYSFTWANVAAGTYTITAMATDNAGAVTTSTAVMITVSNNSLTQSPYGGTPATIPGKIEAEKYDLGGEGIAYHETTAGNSGNAFRTDDVDIETTSDAGGGYNVGWIASGEWLEYTVNVAATGVYNLEARVASQNAGATFHVEMDGVNISGPVTVPNTGAWQTFQSVTIRNISLTAGQKVMRIAMDASWFNINYIAFSSANTPPSVSITSPVSATTFATPATIIISANASDADGSVSNVQFYNGTTLLGSDASAPYSFTWTNVAAGNYTLTATATDNAGAVTTSAPVTITVTTPTGQTPYGGIPATIPGKIEVEKYDLGGEGIAYHETTSGNSGNAFRTDNVDIEATSDAGGGYNVGWIASGEWLEYTVNVAATGTYTIEARVAAQGTGGAFHIEMDGVNVSGAITVPNTGAWQTFQTVTIPNINLTAGKKVMRIAMDGSWFNINYINFSQAVAVASAMLLDASAATELSTVSPNPSTGAFNLTVQEAVKVLTVTDAYGTVVYTGRDIAQGATVQFGEAFASGLYVVYIQYSSGRTETRKIQKQ